MHFILRRPKDHVLCLALHSVAVFFSLALAKTDQALINQEFQEFVHAGEPNLHLISNNVTSFLPWSYEPLCSRGFDASSSSICVYTSKTFAQGRGVSFFTTPTIADQIALLPSFQNLSILTDNGVNPGNHDWYTKSVPGKGIGIFAKHGFQKGDIITINTPLLVAYAEGTLPKFERERLLGVAVEQLPLQAQDSIQHLSNFFTDDQIPLQGIVSGNAFDLQIGGRSHLAVFPEASRINHACMPNAQFHVDPSLLTHQVRTVRPIAQDEEVTIAYSNVLEPHVTRQQHLRKAFHFTCACPRCLRAVAADKALEDIHNLQATLADWGPKSAASVKIAENLVKIYEKEGLEGFMDPAYCLVALTYNAVGSLKGAQKYLNLALQTHKLRLGPSASDLGACNGMLDHFQDHWSWKLRKTV